MFFQALAQLLILMSVGVEDLHRRGYMCLLLIHKGATFWLMYCLNACRITAFMYDSLPGSEKMASVNISFQGSRVPCFENNYISCKYILLYAIVTLI